MKKFSLLAPSRNRAGKLKKFIQSVFDLSEFKNRVEILVYIDLDDPGISDYRSLETSLPCNVTFIYGEPVKVSKSWNILAEQCTGDVLIMGSDDVVYCTHGWDTLLEKELAHYADDIYCAWMEDNINGAKHCAFPIVSRRWYETLGYFTPEALHIGYVDTWIFDIAQRAGRCHFMPHIVAKHLHFSRKKSRYSDWLLFKPLDRLLRFGLRKLRYDDTYARNRIRERGNLYKKDGVLFTRHSAERQADANKLIKLIADCPA